MVSLEKSFTSSPSNTSRSFHSNKDQSLKNSFSLPSDKKLRIFIAVVAQNLNLTEFGKSGAGEGNTTSAAISLLMEKLIVVTW